MRRRGGFSLLELLAVIAVLGIAFGMVALGSRKILQGQEERAAVVTLEQMFRHGATAAASRGEALELVRTGRVLVVRPQGGSRVIKRAELPKDVVLALPEGQVATFSSPGMVNIDPDTFTVETQKETYQLTVSLIGEVKKEVP